MNEQFSEAVHAAVRPEVAAAVLALYARLQFQIDQRKPLCDASGKCCRFDEYGHRLYITTIELATFIHQFVPAKPTCGNPRSLPIAGGGCQFQSENLCTVHAIRPFGCRIFYCDSTATQWQQNQYEVFHAELKALHETLGVQYFYMEWREALAAAGFSNPI